MAALHSVRRHSENNIKDMIAWCLEHNQNPAHWIAKLKELRNEQLEQGNRAARRAKKRAGASQ